MQVHNVEQGSEDWHALRLGKITGSGFNKLLGTKEASQKYIDAIAAEIVTKQRCDTDEFTKGMHINRGNEYEETARLQYFNLTFSEIEQVGFVQRNEYVGCSPDGLIGEDGMLEIKVPDSNNYLSLVLDIFEKGEKAICKDHFMQMQFGIYTCIRDWCDYTLYNHKHVVANKELFIYRIYKCDTTQSIIEETLEKSIARIKARVEMYLNLPTMIYN